jgi:hypothetical protein
MNVKDSKTLAQYGAANPTAVGAHMGQNGDMIYNEPDGKGGVNFYHIPADTVNQPTTEPTTVQLYSIDPDDKTKTKKTPFTIPAGTKKGDLATKLMAINVANDNVLKQTSEIDKSTREGLPDTSGKAAAAASAATDPAEKQRLTTLANQLQQNELKQKEAGHTVVNAGYTPPSSGAPGAAAIQTTTKSGEPVWGRQYGAGDPNSAFENTSRQLALGEKTENDIPKRFAKGQPNTQDYSNRARQITQDMFGKDFEYNPKQIEAEYKDYSNGKYKPAYNAMDRLAGRADGSFDPENPPLLNQLEDAAKKAGLSDNAPINDVIQATKRFFGNDAAKALQFDIAETRKSLSQVTGNPTLGSSDTNLKLQQMEEAYGGDMTVKNLKKVNAEARKAINAERQAGFTNNRFLRRAYGGEAITAAPTGPTGGAPPLDQSNPPPLTLLPVGHDTTFDNGQVWRNVNGKPLRIK